MVETLMLRAGTLYAVEVDGHLSWPRRLEQDIEVYLLSMGPSFRVYTFPDGTWVYVRPEHDLRCGETVIQPFYNDDPDCDQEWSDT